MNNEAIERLQAKTRDGILHEIFIQSFEFSPKTAEAVIQTVKDVYQLDRYDVDVPRIPGQMVRQVISIKAKHGPRLKELPKVTVALTVDAGPEDREVFQHYGAKGLRQQRILRITEEALEQGGLLTQEDLSDLMRVDVRTIRRDTKELLDKGIRVPTRGFCQDIGPTLSHKVWIVQLYLEYHTYSEIARRTRHSMNSIKRYIVDFCRVARCIQHGVAINDIGHIVGISARLAKDYVELYVKMNTPERYERIQDLINAHSEKKGALVS